MPQSPWWTTGRIAFVALYCDILDRTWVVRQSIYRIETDAFGPLLVRDAGADNLLAGPDRVLGPRAGESYRRFTPPPTETPMNTGPRER